MSRINIDVSAYEDARFVRLARYLQLPGGRYEAIGRMGSVWWQCTYRETYLLSVEDAAIALGVDAPDDDVARALVDAELAEKRGEKLRIKGTKGRTDWLATKRKAGRKGGHRSRRQAEGKAESDSAYPESEAHLPQTETPPAPAPAPAPAPSNTPLSPPTGDTPSARKRKKQADQTPEERAVAERVLAKLSERTGERWSAKNKQHVGWVVARLRDGYDEMQLRTVLWHKCNEWLGGEMAEYLRPSTLFRPKNFSEYLPKAEKAWAELQRDGTYVEPEPSAHPIVTDLASTLGGKQ